MEVDQNLKINDLLKAPSPPKKRRTKNVKIIPPAKILAADVAKSNKLNEDVKMFINERDTIMNEEKKKEKNAAEIEGNNQVESTISAFRKMKLLNSPIPLPHNELNISISTAASPSHLKSPSQQLSSNIEEFSINIVETMVVDESKIGCLKYCQTLEDLTEHRMKELNLLGDTICCWFCTRPRSTWGKKVQPLTVPVKYVESYYQAMIENEGNNTKTNDVKETIITKKSIRKCLSKSETIVFLRNIIKNEFLSYYNNLKNSPLLHNEHTTQNKNFMELKKYELSDILQVDEEHVEKFLHRKLKLGWSKEQIISYIEMKPILAKNLVIRDYFMGIGIVCSFNCMVSYLMMQLPKNILFKDSPYLMRKLYKHLFGVNINFGTSIKPSPNIYCLQKFGGDISDEDYFTKQSTTSDEDSHIRVNLANYENDNKHLRTLKDIFLVNY